MDLILKPYAFMQRQVYSYRALSCAMLGAIFSLGLPPFHYWYVSLISLAIFFNIFVLSKPPKSIFTAVFIFSLSYFTISSYWIINTFLVVVNGLLPGILAGIITLFVVTTYMAVITALCILISEKFTSINKYLNFNLSIILIPLAWALSEYIRSTLLGGQPMHYVGYMVGNNDYLIQIASIFNVYVVSFFLVLIAVLFSIDYRHAICGALILCAVSIFGIYRVELMPDSQGKEIKELKVRLVNANLTQAQLLQDQNTFRVVDEYINVTQSASSASFIPDLIIWPESVLQFYIDNAYEGEINRKHITEFMSEGQLLITGGPRHERTKNKNIKYYSSMFQLDSEGKLLNSYDKHRLVPWGEFIPFRDFIPEKIANIFDVKDYTPGKGPLKMNSKYGVKILPLLCAEGHYPQMLSEYQDEQNLIVMIGNEAWLEGTTEPSQYFINARYRAVESGLPVLLVSNKGYLAIIDNKGIVKKSIYNNKASVLDGHIEVILN